jgi:hypothetical protein
MRQRRRPEAANVTTWSVIAGSLILVVAFLGSARAGNGYAGALVVVALLAFAAVLALVAHVNIFQVLWGQTVDEGDAYIRHELVIPLTLPAIVLGYGVFAWALVSGEDWGWFAPLAAILATGYLLALLLSRRGTAGNVHHQSEHDQ